MKCSSSIFHIHNALANALAGSCHQTYDQGHQHDKKNKGQATAAAATGTAGVSAGTPLFFINGRKDNEIIVKARHTYLLYKAAMRSSRLRICNLREIT
ncbi:MAG: hypothetical protein Q4B73_08115 [Lachnospiraceae bacterium]|nr:hypothetical protein [Lachnospiraceae bacterium]